MSSDHIVVDSIRFDITVSYPIGSDSALVEFVAAGPFAGRAAFHLWPSLVVSPGVPIFQPAPAPPPEHRIGFEFRRNLADPTIVECDRLFSRLVETLLCNGASDDASLVQAAFAAGVGDRRYALGLDTGGVRPVFNQGTLRAAHSVVILRDGQDREPYRLPTVEELRELTSLRQPGTVVARVIGRSVAYLPYLWGAGLLEQPPLKAIGDVRTPRITEGSASVLQPAARGGWVACLGRGPRP